MMMDYAINSDALKASEDGKKYSNIERVIYLYSEFPSENILSVLKGYFKDITKKQYLPKEYDVVNDKETLVVFDCTGLKESELYTVASIFGEKHNGNGMPGFVIVGTPDSFSVYSALRKFGSLYSTKDSLGLLISDIILSDFKLLYSSTDSTKVKNGCMIISCAGGVGGSSISNEIASYLATSIENAICLFEKNSAFRMLNILNEITQDKVLLDELTGDVIHEHFRTFSHNIQSNLNLYSLEAQTQVGFENHNLLEKLLSEIYYFFISDYSFSEIYKNNNIVMDNVAFYDKYFFVVNGSLPSLVNLCKLLAIISETDIASEKINIIFNDNGATDIACKTFEEKFKDYNFYYLPRVSLGDYVSSLNARRTKLNKKYHKVIHKISVNINNNSEFDSKKGEPWTQKLKLFTRKH